MASLDFSMLAPSTLGEKVVPEAVVAPTGDPTCDDIMATAFVHAGGMANLSIVSGVWGESEDSPPLGVWSFTLKNAGPDPVESVRFIYSAPPDVTCGNFEDCNQTNRINLGVGESTVIQVTERVARNVTFFVTAIPVSSGASAPLGYDMLDPDLSDNSLIASGSNLWNCGLVSLELLLIVPIVRLARRWRRRR